MQANRPQISRLLKTARGQIDGILKMIEEDKYCLDISHQLLASEALLKKANREILRAHMQNCVQHALECGSQEEARQKIDEMIAIMNKMTK